MSTPRSILVSVEGPSVALVCQVVTVDKSLFEQRVGSLSRRKLSEVDRGLRLALGLGIAPA